MHVSLFFLHGAVASTWVHLQQPKQFSSRIDSKEILYILQAAPRLATSVCQLRHDQMEQGHTEPHTGRSTFLLSSGGAGGGYY